MDSMKSPGILLDVLLDSGGGSFLHHFEELPLVSLLLLPLRPFLLDLLHFLLHRLLVTLPILVEAGAHLNYGAIRLTLMQ